MLSWILQITIISFVLIFLVHYLFNFFKSTLTVPKIKDLVNSPTQKYESMFNVISKSNSIDIFNANTNGNSEYSLTDLLPKSENTMKSELKNFLKKQLNTTNSSANVKNSTTSITALDSMMSNSYSEFN